MEASDNNQVNLYNYKLIISDILIPNCFVDYFCWWWLCVLDQAMIFKRNIKCLSELVVLSKMRNWQNKL